MCARTLALGLSGVALLAPAIAFAQSPSVSALIGGFPTIPRTALVRQSAVHVGDTPFVRVFVNSSTASAPSATVDFSAVGDELVQVSEPTAGVTPSWFYDVPFTVGVGTTDGVKDIPITATDVDGLSASTVARVTVDNTPPVPTFSLTLSTTSPNEGDTMYLSGKIDGTGTRGSVSQVRLLLTDASGEPVSTDNIRGGTFNYNEEILKEALASDGTFSNVPYTIITFGDRNWFPQAAFLILTIEVYDEAGNFASSSVTLPINSVDPPPPPPTPKVSSVLFIPGTQASRLYMINPLTGQERQLWEPSVASDVGQLAMNPDGTSINRVYTKDIIGDLYDNTLRGDVVKAGLGNDVKVYSDFELFMDSLVASSTLGMHEWRAYPYDWRYDPIDVANEGTLTKLPGGSVERVYLEDVVDQMASSSATGKVTIVTHSNGGLVAKALMQELAEEGKAGKVDNIVFIGTPHWGTPVDIGVMHHGDGQSQGLGLVMYAPEVRAVTALIPDAYALLPSEQYFAHVADKVATFAPGGMSEPFRTRFPAGIGSWEELVAFASDAYGLSSFITDPDILDKPLALSPSLLAKAAATHEVLDVWTPPPGVKVTSIAGWGQLTTYRYDYAQSIGHRFCLNIFTGFSCTTKPQFIHTPQMTEDGDGTVVSPSAVGAGGDVKYFNAKRFGDEGNKYFVHRNITSAAPIQETIIDLLQDIDDTNRYMVLNKPQTDGSPLTIISAHSPVNLLVTDAQGNDTGIISVPGLDGIYFPKQDIPGSAVEVSGENKFVFLPQGATYSITATGYASGPANIVITNLDAEGTVVASTTTLDIPVATSTAVSFTVSSTGAPSPLAIDLNGDGATDTVITPQEGAATRYPYRWEGFVQPIDDPARQAGATPSVFKGGSTVPVKFVLKNHTGQLVQATTPPQWLPPQKGAPMSAPVDESVYTGTATIGTTFKWDSATGQYIYNWSTKGLATGYWYRISVKLDDGTSYSVVLGLR